MKSTQDAGEALRQLHTAFLELRQEPALERRRILVHQMILHPLLRQKMHQVVARRKYCWPDEHSRQDVIQEATCFLIDWLTDADAPYQDEGPDQFGGWLWTLCSRACSRATLKDLRPPRRRVVTFDFTDGTEIAAPPDCNRSRRQLVEAIEALPDPDMRAVLLDFLHGYRIRESAERLGLCPTAVFRLREKGHRELRKADIDFP
jgi:DNA-directed RNA polymerase specialized sigma24 family protein